MVKIKECLKQIESITQGSFVLQPLKETPKIPSKPLMEKSMMLLDQCCQKIVLKSYSSSTLKSYRGCLIRFLTFFENRDINEISKEDIEAFIAHLKSKYGISDVYQNQLINSIKFLYEQVLGKDRIYYDLQRPKKSRTLPNVLSLEEVTAILNQPKNIKHRAILCTIYSAGLRLAEVINLRIEDIHSKEGYIFVKAAKGKKDRRTLLSDQLLLLLRAYYKAHKPAYWLFEGADGEKYGRTSVQKIFRKSVREAKVNPWCTVHTLRHSFATHILQQGGNFRYVQHLLGHESSKTTEIYTHILKMNNRVVSSPMDKLKINLS